VPVLLDIGKKYPIRALWAAIRAANMQLVRTGDDEFMLVTLKQATPQAGSQPAMTPETVYAAIAHGDEEHRAWLLSALRAVWCGEAVPPVASPIADAAAESQPEPVREHDLQDVRCECCGYMTYHLEHMGCIRAARAPADSVTAPAGVAYLDIGAGGYIDLGTDLSNEALSRLPKGRHVLVIAGTYGIDGYIPTPPAQAADSVLEDAARWQWLADYLIGERTDLDEGIVACATIDALRQFVDAARKQGGA
jgi:hypothetical protein